MLSSVAKSFEAADCFFGQKSWHAMTSEWEIFTVLELKSELSLPYIKAAL